ncbi:hypothetical protein GALMADRAFT_811416 [Galerina marginata CBS 339.88]|uniref:Uncharacterized protein n=1 Tax=Galerina marginata (strain CBS 339.88) TaxID=685588 RepID=A0A067ST34_GALM3|nr:hypothetical protein GALMADRAFT_811416 [Galerina marginata CBS 339.88]
MSTDKRSSTTLAGDDFRITARETRRNISRAEPCFITKRHSYTLERVHWVDAVSKDKRKIEEFLKELGVVHINFTLNDASNLTNLDRMLHVCLEKGFFAVTASLETLKLLIAIVEEQNRTWQNRFDQGEGYIRTFGVSHSFGSLHETRLFDFSSFSYAVPRSRTPSMKWWYSTLNISSPKGAILPSTLKRTAMKCRSPGKAMLSGTTVHSGNRLARRTLRVFQLLRSTQIVLGRCR